MARGQHGVDGDDQSFRPICNWTNGSGAPVEVTNEIGHLAGAENPGGTGDGGSGGGDMNRHLIEARQTLDYFNGVLAAGHCGREDWDRRGRSRHDYQSVMFLEKKLDPSIR